MSDVLLVQGNARQIPLADQSVHCCITSPPYYRLRDYNEPEQIGLEPLHDCLGWAHAQNCGRCYICVLRQVFAECWRVLRDDGTLWIIIGDSYNAAGRVGQSTRIGYKQSTNRASPAGVDHCRATAAGLKPKDLIGIPWRLALALQQDGWTLRNECIWEKPNSWPESVKDRCTRSHETVFLFSKRRRYCYDQEPLREPHKEVSLARIAKTHHTPGHKWEHGPGNQTIANDLTHACHPSGRNAHTVWTITTESYKGQHFATFPTDLARRCILAGTSEHGVCSKCAAPYRRILEREKGDVPSYNGSSFTKDKTHAAKAALATVGHGERTVSVRTLGWEPSCRCAGSTPCPAVVLDPFTGSSTTLLAARELGRHGIGLDLSWPYLHEDSRKRLGLTALARWQGHEQATPSITYDDLPLFGNGRRGIQ